jgi:hypothetical protein
MAEGYKSALIASLRGDAPQGPLMGSGVSPLTFDWMRNNGVPLSFEARRMALLNPERLALPLPATRPMPTGGYEDGPIPPEVDPNEPDLGPPPALEEPQVVSDGGAGDAPMPPPPPEPEPEIPYVPEEEEQEEEEEPPTAIIVEPVNPGDDIFVNEPDLGVPDYEEVIENLPPPQPPPPPPPPPPAAVVVEPVNAGDDIFSDDYIPEEEVVIPDVPEEKQEEEEKPEPVFDLIVEGPIEQPLVEEPNLVEPGPIDFQPPDPILEENIRDWTEPEGEITIDEFDLIDPGPVDFVNIPLRDYGSDLGTTVIEGAFDPTLGGIFDPGSEIISPISGPNNPYDNPFIGLSPQQLNELLFGGP